ncbi:ribonuclease P protein subunit p38 [Silurus meridionalis]|nr:ribonuclease P protein subunit p38 [Silurus meridionalis]
MATPGQKATKKEKKKPLPVKTCLGNPYDLKWKPLEKGQARFILKTVTEKLSSLDLRKQHGKVFRKWRRKRKDKKENQESMDTAEPTQKSDERCWTDKRLRNELAIGINEVTKGLERNELGLVLVCDSVKPAHMTSHLISLSQTRAVPACQVPGLSAGLAGALGLGSVLALGFKRQSGTFADTVEALAAKTPPLAVAWVPPGAHVSESKRVEMSEETKQEHEEEKLGRGRKRRLEDCLEVQDPVISLQPLKVKKIIPNPLKIRKTKQKKAKQK